MYLDAALAGHREASHHKHLAPNRSTVCTVTRDELFDALVAARPQDGDLVYVERRSEEYSLVVSAPGDVVSTPTGDYPEAWVYWTACWPPDDAGRQQATFKDLLDEMNSMTGGIDRCRWDPNDPYPHSH